MVCGDTMKASAIFNRQAIAHKVEHRYIKPRKLTIITVGAGLQISIIKHS